MDKAEQISDGFHKLLNQHGFGFQYAVLKRAMDLATSKHSKWQAQASEFPTEVQDKPTHIDFLLKRPERDYFLVCECKRVNASLANWCFAKSPFVRLYLKSTSVIAEQVTRVSDGSPVFSKPYQWAQSPNIFHLGLEVRANQKSDSIDSGRNAITEAVTQVLRGTNGLANLYGRYPQMLKPSSHILLIPVVFTTATLWMSDVKLDSADVETGKLTNTAELRKTGWLIYDHHQSPGIRHSLLADGALNTLDQILIMQYARSICIVSWEGIDDFLSWSSAQ